VGGDPASDRLVGANKTIALGSSTPGVSTARRHGARLVFGAQVDHVVPYSLGGTTTRENLVTACWACNFGKRNYHRTQLALDDPRERPPSDAPFDGFTSLQRALRRAGKS